jgi:5-formyltetrahydrofolate cyclo-ligase
MRAATRLGYGGGFYDRTLALLRASGPVTAMGFAYAAQELPELPTDAFDQPLDLIVTEEGVRRFAAEGWGRVRTSFGGPAGVLAA